MLFFFIHRFNDIDHLTPVIYRIANDTKEKIMVLSLNPFYDISSDFRLMFLKEKYNVPIDYLYNIHNPSLLYKIFSYFSRSYPGDSLKDNVKIIFKRFKSENKYRKTFHHDLYQLICRFGWTLMVHFKIFNKLIIKHYGKKWVEEMIEFFKPLVLIFDHAATNRLFNVSAILHVSGKKGIPTISLPHGIPLFKKHSSDYDRAKIDFVQNQCDFLVLQHRWWRDECIEYGLSPDKVSILGIARHCKEWESILEQIVPPDRSLQYKGNGKLKVVYMDSGPDRYHEYKSMAQEAVDKISRLDFVHFIYKPHTRRNSVHFKLPSSAEVIKNINSINLIKWADVVIGMHSSIMIEVLLQDKVYISPTYFRKRKMIYEEYKACWLVNSHKELEEALRKLNKNPSFRPYAKENVERFLTDVVYDGEKDKDVLGAYKKFILDIAEGKYKLLR